VGNIGRIQIGISSKSGKKLNWFVTYSAICVFTEYLINRGLAKGKQTRLPQTQRKMASQGQSDGEDAWSHDVQDWQDGVDPAYAGVRLDPVHHAALLLQTVRSDAFHHMLRAVCMHPSFRKCHVGTVANGNFFTLLRCSYFDPQMLDLVQHLEPA
jgi:hypothetical protein